MVISGADLFTGGKMNQVFIIKEHLKEKYIT